MITTSIENMRKYVRIVRQHTRSCVKVIQTDTTWFDI